ncbi:hypothetical protein E2C01_029804 [Portunus trituberculatus]|uniref:Uncharacterized protein n=1 Tax=Portunus trituberculatus TaxID=210409 RepID=A0A5B7ESZ4_PORTR|nr:hypothetical protein [Portunus trituberculatus]
MPLFGHIGEFDEFDKSAWEEWCDRLEQYFLTNKVEDDAVKRAVFLSSVRAATYSTLSSLCSPKKPKELPFAELLKLLQGHYAPKPSTVVARFRFNSCKKAGNRRLKLNSMPSYLAQLCALRI